LPEKAKPLIATGAVRVRVLWNDQLIFNQFGLIAMDFAHSFCFPRNEIYSSRKNLAFLPIRRWRRIRYSLLLGFVAHHPGHRLIAAVLQLAGAFLWYASWGILLPPDTLSHRGWFTETDENTCENIGADILSHMLFPVAMIRSVCHRRWSFVSRAWLLNFVPITCFCRWRSWRRLASFTGLSSLDWGETAGATGTAHSSNCHPRDGMKRNRGRKFGLNRFGLRPP